MPFFRDSLARVPAVLQADIEKLISAQLSTQVNPVAAELDEELRVRIESLN